LFVFVAAKPAELSPPRTSVERYKKVGGADWRPFHPDVKERVSVLAELAATRYERYYTELPIDAGLIEALDRAGDNHEPVLVLVDPWTLKVGRYQVEMKKLDKYLADTCAILVSWNTPDSETEAERDTLKGLIQQTFPNRVKHGKSLHYWGEVDSAAALSGRLLEILAHYTNRAIESTSTPAEKEIPEGEILTAANDPGVPLGQPAIVDNSPAPNG
jgi:FxsC-like protein